MDTLCMQSIKIVKPDHTSKINHNLEDHLATANNNGVFETRIFVLKKVMFHSSNDPWDKIKISETLFHIHRTPKNYSKR